MKFAHAAGGYLAAVTLIAALAFPPSLYLTIPGCVFWGAVLRYIDEQQEWSR